MSGHIESATTYETSIEIIDTEESREGINFLQQALQGQINKIGDASLIPINDGGNRVGDELAQTSGLELNPMHMSHTKPDNSFSKKALCVEKPDINLILGKDNHTKPVIFAEAVIETQSTIQEAMATINQMIDEYNAEHDTAYPHPEYYTLALVSKIDGPSDVPNLINAFRVTNLIWIHGWGCDDTDPTTHEHRGREKNSIWGRLPEKFKEVPDEPYYERNFE